jgi:hypothetical protein
MKNKYLILLLLLGFSGVFTMQSCTKEKEATPVIFKADIPANPTPAVDAVLPLGGNTYTLKWEGTTLPVDLYLGTSDSPPLAQAHITTKTYTFTTTTGGEFFWYITDKDANGKVVKSPTWSFYINSPPNVPVLTTPAVNAVNFPVTGAFAWTGTDPEGDDLTYNFFIGTTTSTIQMVATGLTAPTYSPTMQASTKYFWQVVATDTHGASTSSVLDSLTTGLDPITKYTGNYTVDEPAEGWTYPVTISRGSSTTITLGPDASGNYGGWWASWTATFTLDLNKLTYVMPRTTFTSGYEGAESGVLTPSTGVLTGTYTVWHNGNVIEQGVHTYTKN